MRQVRPSDSWGTLMHEPYEEQRKWARSQMTAADYPAPIQLAVERLLDVWWTQNHTDKTRDATLTLFEKLARNQSIIAPHDVDELWAALKPGNVVVRDQVRVKADAYRDEAGRLHNGRRGVVIAIRHGDIIIKYDDGKHPPFDGVHHSPHSLEKRVR